MKYLFISVLFLLPYIIWGQQIKLPVEADGSMSKQFKLDDTLDYKGAVIEFKDKGKIVGRGVIKNAVIKASIHAQIFSPEIKLINVKTTDDRFSAKWFGATGNGSSDDYIPLQNALDYVCNNTSACKTLYFPGGKYRISKGLVAYRKKGAEYEQLNIRISGQTSGITANPISESVLLLDNNNSFCLALQEVYGAVVENLAFEGSNMLNYSLKQAFDPASKYIKSNQRDNRYSPYAGLVLDPFRDNVPEADRYPDFKTFYTNHSNGGSTSSTFRNMSISGFVVNILLTAGLTQNNESHLFDKIWLANCKVGFVTSNSQERNTRCTRMFFWNSVKTCFSNAGYGRSSGSMPFIDGCNIAGNVYQLFDFSGRIITYDVLYVNNLYAESLYRIGIIDTQRSKFTACNINFQDLSAIGLKERDFILVSPNPVEFDNCILVVFAGGKRFPLNIYGNKIRFNGSKINNLIAQAEDIGQYLDNINYDGVDLYNGNFFVMDIDYYRTSGYFVPARGVLPGRSITWYEGSSFKRYYQTRKITSPITKYLNSTKAVTVTVTGNKAKAFIPEWAGLKSLLGEVVTTKLAVQPAGYFKKYEGNLAIMRLASIDESGNAVFDNVIESMVSGNYMLRIMTHQVCDPIMLAKKNGQQLTNIVREGACAEFTPQAGSVVYMKDFGLVLGSNGRLLFNFPINDDPVILSNYMYEESGISYNVPDQVFPPGTLFTKGAIYKNSTQNNDVAGWICIKTGISGCKDYKPLFKTL